MLPAEDLVSFNDAGDERFILNPLAEQVQTSPAPLAPRRPLKSGDRVALVDISKPGGSVLLTRLEALLLAAVPGLLIQRVVKPRFSAPIPADMLEGLRGCTAAVLALAD